MLGEPDAVVLEADLVAVRNVAADRRGMTTLVKDRRRGGLQVLGDVKIARDIKTGTGLEVKLLDGKRGRFDLARHDRLETGPRRHRPQAEHFQKLPPQLGPLLLPIVL